MDLNGGLTYEGYGAVEDFPVVVFGVDIADMVDIGTLLAGGSNDVGGLNPDTVNRGITPIGNNNECIEDNAVAGVGD